MQISEECFDDHGDRSRKLRCNTQLERLWAIDISVEFSRSRRNHEPILILEEMLGGGYGGCRFVTFKRAEIKVLIAELEELLVEMEDAPMPRYHGVGSLAAHLDGTHDTLEGEHTA